MRVTFRTSGLWFVCLVILCTDAGFVSLAHAQQDQGANETFKFQSGVRVVLVPVVVRDNKGEALGDLTKQDFQIFDNGKRQVISGFQIQTRTPLLVRSGTTRNLPGSDAKKPELSIAIPERFIVFLFDDLHLSDADLSMVRKAAAHIAGDLLGPTDMAAVISTSARTNTGFTHDRTKLEEAIRKLVRQPMYSHTRGACPEVSYYQADLIENMNDGEALAEAIADVQHCAPGTTRDAAEGLAKTAARLELATGDMGVQVTLNLMKQVVRQMGVLPGDKHTLVFVSPGFQTPSMRSRLEQTRLVDLAMQGNVTINTLDGRGLYTNFLDMSVRSPSRMKEQYQRESAIAEGQILAEFAAGTGGTYFRDNNDLTEGFRRLTEEPEYVYRLEFSPQEVKSDGAYHRLKIKVSKDHVKLQTRQGYFAEKTSKIKASR